MRCRASIRQTRRPAPESSRAAAKPAAPAPMIRTSKEAGTRGVVRMTCRRAQLLGDDLGPGKFANGHHALVDVALRGLVAKHPAQIINFRRNELVVFRQESNRC